MLFFVPVAVLSSFSTAHAAGEAPVAEAGLGLIAYVGDTVILDGSGSSDPEGDPLSYAWTQVGGEPVELARADTPQPQFEIVGAGTLRFSLVVRDDLTESAADSVEVVVPHEAIAGVETGCASAPGVAGVGGLFLAGLAVRRRARGHRSR